MPLDPPATIRAPILDALVSLRTTSRSRVPFGWRLAARRAPAVARWLGAARLPRASAERHTLAQRSSPLRRARTAYAEALQHGKEHNVRRVAAALDGLMLAPGAVLSWNAEVGPPLRLRGFVDGPELHDGVLVAGVGGGACQVANLVYWLAVHAGLDIVERHRHALDLFPDDHRDVPFGLGATVFWPTRDLVVRNALSQSVHLSLSVGDGLLHGQLTSSEPARARYEVVERDHRFEREGTAVVRCNRLFRVRTAPDGARSEHLLAEHRARVAYPVPASAFEPEVSP